IGASCILGGPCGDVLDDIKDWLFPTAPLEICSEVGSDVTPFDLSKSRKRQQGACSCQHRDVFTSGGVSCQALRETGVCTGPYAGVGTDRADCQTNARENAPMACQGCLGHCLFTPGTN